MGDFEQVTSLKVTTGWGPVELLPGYAPSLIALEPGLIDVQHGGGFADVFALKRGALSVDESGKVVILAGKLFLPKEVALPQLRQRLEKLEADGAGFEKQKWPRILLALAERAALYEAQNVR